MVDNGERRSMLRFSWGNKTLEARGVHVVLLMLVLVVGATSALVWAHAKEASTANEQYISAMQFVSRAITNTAVAQREFACILAKDEGESRRRAFETGECRRLARTGVDD